MEPDKTPTSQIEQLADEKLEAAVTSARDSAAAVRNWNTVLREFRGMYEQNGFGQNMKRIMMMPVKET